MNEKIFIKQNHKNLKVAFIPMYMFISIIITFCMITYNKYYILGVISLIVILIFFSYMIKFFDSYGIYVLDEKVYYKTVKKKEVDISKVVGVKVIKSEAQVNLAWSPFIMKDKTGSVLYSMIFLSEIEDGMARYTFGDIEFIRNYKENVVMYSIYDESFIEWLVERRDNIKVIY